MNTVGIIAEYNPFHKGHQYHLEKARALTGCGHCLVLMSGSFVQRGEPALLDKYDRAAMALRCGADCVAELPAPFSTGAARTFAESSVTLLGKTGLVTDLVFGSECGDTDALLSIARILLEEPPAYSSSLKDHLREGLPFPKASAMALQEVLPHLEAQQILSGPNNLLGIEYLRAVMEQDLPIRCHTIPRTSSYTETNPDRTPFPSALSLRMRWKEAPPSAEDSFASLAPYLPLEALPFVREEALFPDDFTPCLQYALWEKKEEELALYEDVGPDLAKRILSLEKELSSWTGFAAEVKSRQITLARVNRALLHIVLGIRESDLRRFQEEKYGSALHILGARADYLKEGGLSFRDLTPVTRLATELPLLDDVSREILELERRATRLYRGTAAVKYQRKIYPDEREQRFLCPY